MKLHYNIRNADLQLSSILGSKYLIKGGEKLSLYSVSKFLVTKNMIDSNNIENSWQAENDDLFSIIYLQLMAYKSSSIRFRVDWSRSKFSYNVALKLMSNDSSQDLFKNIFLNSYSFRSSDNGSNYRKLIIIKLIENQLLIKLLRFSGFYYATPVNSLNVVLDLKAPYIVNDLKRFETSLRLNGLSVQLL